MSFVSIEFILVFKYFFSIGEKKIYKGIKIFRFLDRVLNKEVRLDYNYIYKFIIEVDIGYCGFFKFYIYYNIG